MKIFFPITNAKCEFVIVKCIDRKFSQKLVIYLQVVTPSMSTNSFSTLHQVPEGHVGVYWRGGALLSTITNPG